MTTPSRISPREFEAIVDEALGGVPEAFRRYLDNVVVDAVRLDDVTGGETDETGAREAESVCEGAG